MTPAQMKSQSVAVALLLALASSAVFTRSARGEEPLEASRQAAYRDLVDQALAEYTAKNFAEARSLFSKAVEIYPSARALRGLGMAEFELRNYGDSASVLQQSLDSSVQPLPPKLREETQRLLERAKGFVARLQVAVEPAVATVIVDGMPVQLGHQGNLVLEVGDHTIEFRAEGYAPEKRVVKVRGGEAQTLRIALPPAPTATASDPRATQPEATDPLRAGAVKRWFVVPRLTLLFPTAIRFRTEVACSSDVNCDVDGGGRKKDRNAGVFFGGDVLFSPVANFRIGLGVHLQLNQIEQDTEEGTKSEYGRALWVPLVTEYAVPVSSIVSIPLRGMFGFAMFTGGKTLDDAEDDYRENCDALGQAVDAEKCTIKGGPAPGFVLGLGPGVSVQLGKVALRSDLTLGYQRYRGAKLESKDVRLEQSFKGLLAAWSLAAEF